MRVHLVNPSDVSFGIGVITPRWLYVLAAATPAQFGTPIISDETLEQLDPEEIRPGDVVGIGIHTANAYRGLQVGRIARARGAWVVFGGIHATLYPDEPRELGGAHSVVRGDGDAVWGAVLRDCAANAPEPLYEGGRVNADTFLRARWDLMPPRRYMWASVQTVRGCPKHCSFCSVWRTDGQKPRQRSAGPVIEELIELRRRGYRFIALADDNFYPVTLADLERARRQNNLERLRELESMRAERFALLDAMSHLPDDMFFFTQITMEAAEDPAFLDAMCKARVRGALVGVETVASDGLKTIYKDFNATGSELAERLRTFRRHGVYVLGSFIFGLPTDRAATFPATAALAKESELMFAQFVMMTPFPGTVDFERWEKSFADQAPTAGEVPITRYWLMPGHLRPKIYTPHPTMSAEQIRRGTQAVWDTFYKWSEIWERTRFIKSVRARLALLLISKLYRQMYANTGIAIDSARRDRANRWARWIAKPCRLFFQGRPLPGLQIPGAAVTDLVTIAEP